MAFVHRWIPVPKTVPKTMTHTRHSVKYFQPDPSTIIHAECVALCLTYRPQSGLTIISNFLFWSGSTSLNTHTWGLENDHSFKMTFSWACSYSLNHPYWALPPSKTLPANLSPQGAGVSSELLQSALLGILAGPRSWVANWPVNPPKCFLSPPQ